VTAEIGHLALVFALFLSIVGAVMPHIALARGDMRWISQGRSLAVGCFLLIAAAFAALIEAFMASDFSLAVVASNSHTLKPTLYKFVGVWGNHEGSLLLWVLVLSLFTACVAVFGARLPDRLRARVLAVQSALLVGFLLFILLTSNPFDRLNPAPVEGNGLNPLLQDIGLAIHPPMLYLGYVGLSVSFSFAVAALIDGDVTPAWARWVRPWTLLAWMFLTGGIALGAGWAYYELGWGGWWFWDPTENASFMPWLAATALLHSAIVVEKRDALKSWTVLLALIAFAFSLLGTFLVRSGVVTSVHAFATDPERGMFILAFLTLVIGASLCLYALRAGDLTPGGLFQNISREGALVLNNVLLASYAGVVLLGTLYPLLLEAVNGDQISVGPPFFNFATSLLMSPLIIALMAGPLLSWKRAALGKALLMLLPFMVIGTVGAAAIFWTHAGGTVMTAFGLLLGFGLSAAVIAETRPKPGSKVGETAASKFGAWGRALLRRTRAQWGMSAAHMGLAVIVLGITISEAWTTERLATLAIGESVDVGAYQFTLSEVEPIAGKNYSAVRARFDVTRDGQPVASLTPEDRVYGNPVTQTSEAGIAPRIAGDLYAVIGELGSDGLWSVRLYVKPFVSGLWLGAAMMVFGGFLSLTDRRLRLALPKASGKAAAGSLRAGRGTDGETSPAPVPGQIPDGASVGDGVAR